MTSPIDQLATQLGILPSYVGYSGQPVTTSPETQVALITAMGFDASSPGAAEDALRNLVEEELREVLDPVIVHHHGAQNVIRARVPRRAGATRWKIAIRSERGRLATRQGLHDAAGPLEIETPNFGPGYYDVRLALTTTRGETEARQLLIVVPDRCVTPQDLLGDRKAFGIYANLYSLRGDSNWGVGDVGDVETMIQWMGQAGGSFVGLNPLHALLNRGNDVSPYGPVSRLWRNPIYIDISRVPEFRDAHAPATVCAPEISEVVASLRESPRVQYEQVWATKSLALDALHSTFLELRSRNAGHPRVQAFNEFVEKGGRWLESHVAWMVIAESRGEWNWKTWPADLQDAQSDAVRQFVASHERRADFHKWAQFELDRQLGDAAASARGAGLEIGLYQDLAVGSSGTGSDAWAHRDLFREGVSIGAPPDPYSDFGQNWGLPPLDPRAMRRDGYRYFIRLVRHGFRHAGALRMDHVMGLFRLFWIPEGATGKQGAYVKYPSEDLLGILALESQRHHAIVVGEDLGVVPDDVPPAMKKWGLLSSRVLYFEREQGGGFKPQSSYPGISLASANTHDMPTLAGFWSGRDIALRTSLGLVDGQGDEQLRQERTTEKHALVDRLRSDGALPLHEHPADDAAGIEQVKHGAHRFLCASPAALVALSLDDLGGEVEPVNVPGVGPDRYPCWGRKMRHTVAEIAAMSTEDLAACENRIRRS